MKRMKCVIGVVLLSVLATTLSANINVPSEVDPSSGKLNFSVTLTTMTGRGFDLPLVFSYRSDMWNKNTIFYNDAAHFETWIKGPTPFGFGWNCNLGGRTFKIQTDTGLTDYDWFFVGNNNSVHPFNLYEPYFTGLSDWRTIDNTNIKIGYFSSTGSTHSCPTLPNGVCYDSSTEYLNPGSRKIADNGLSGYRYYFIRDANGNRPFYFDYDYVEGQYMEQVLTKISGIEDTALFCYSASSWDVAYPPVLDSVVVYSDDGYERVFHFHISEKAVSIPSDWGWGSSALTSYWFRFNDDDSLTLLDSISMDGDILYRFSYNDEGELASVENRTGGKKEYFYGTHSYWEDSTNICRTRRVDSVKVTPRSGETYTWKYEAEIDSLCTNPKRVKVSTPAGGEVHFDLYSFAWNNCDSALSRSGLVREARFFPEAANAFRSNYLYKNQSFWVTDQTGDDAVRWNARIDSTHTFRKGTDGGDNWESYTTTTEEDNYNNPLKVLYHTTTSSWGYFTKYVFNTSSNYTDKNMINMVTDIYTGWISDNEYLSKTSYDYDDTTTHSYGGSPKGWVNPGDNYRGNLTRVTAYGAKADGYPFNVFGSGGDSSVVKYHYDQFGNQIKGISYSSSTAPETTFTRYSNTNHYVFPVRTVNHVTSNVDSLYTEIEWDFHTGSPDTTWGFNGRWTTYTYDDFGRVLTVKRQGESSASVRHHYYDTQSTPYQIDSMRLDASHWLISRTYTDGFGTTIQTQQLDNSGSKTLVTDYSVEVEEGRSRVSNTREVSSALSSYQTPNWGSLDKITVYFDVLGRDTLAIDQLEKKTWSEYGIDGAPWTLVTVENDTADYWRSWTKTINDERGRTRKVIHGGKHVGITKSDTTIFSYILNHYPVSLVGNVRNPKGDTTCYYYDKSTRLCGINGPDVAADTTYGSHDVDVLFEYDDLGRVVEKSTPLGGVQKWFDEMGRVTRIRTREAGESEYTSLVNMSYDSTINARGRLSELKMFAVRLIVYDYDSLGQMSLKKVRMPFFSYWKKIYYGYNHAGLLIWTAYPAPDTGSSTDTVKYNYDNFGRLSSVPGFVSSVSYGTNGLVDTVTYQNNVKTGYSYNDRLSLTQIATKYGTSNRVNLSYSYEDNGLIHRITDNRDGSHTQTYKYDFLGQLANFSSTAVTDSFEYDGAGNRTLKRHAGTNYTYVYTSNTNRLDTIQGQGWGFAYDSSGNIVSQINGSDSLFFEYDVLSRLTEFRNHSDIDEYNPNADDTIVDYTYGGAGDLRARKRIRVCEEALPTAGPFLKMYDDFDDLVLDGSGFDTLTDPARDMGDIYVRNCTDTFYMAIFPNVVDPTMSTVNFMIAVDLDRVEGSGKARLPEDTMTLLPSDAWWETCFYLHSLDSFGLYDTSYTKRVQPGGMSVQLLTRYQLDGAQGGSASDTAYLITIIKGSIPLDSIMRITVFSFKPGFTNDNEYLNGGSSASDVVPGAEDCMDFGTQDAYDEVYDPDPNDTSPGSGYRFSEFYRVYLYSKGLNPIVEYSAPYGGEYDHAPVRYVYGFPGAIARIVTTGTGRDTFFLHKDANGSVRSITNTSGTEVAAYWYDPFGNLVDSTGSDTGNTRRFVGKDWDKEHSHVYMAARYYDPRFGRFTSRDPEHTTMSPYAYCLNNPVSLIDPTGHAAGCGGSYAANYPTSLWKMVYHSPGLNIKDPTRDLSLSFGTNPTFTDASGGNPFRPMWADEGAREMLIKLFHGVMAMFDLDPTIQIEYFYGAPYVQGTMIKNPQPLTQKQKELFTAMVLITCLLSHELKGPIATSASGETETTNLKEILIMALENAPSSVRVYKGFITGLGKATAAVVGGKDLVWGTDLESGTDRLSWNFDPFHPTSVTGNIPANTNMQAVTFTFLHEIFHLATPAYDAEYRGGPNPDEHVPSFIWW